MGGCQVGGRGVTQFIEGWGGRWEDCGGFGYWDCYDGFRLGAARRSPIQIAAIFSKRYALGLGASWIAVMQVSGRLTLFLFLSCMQFQYINND